jgi:ankyrin repeat protein
MWASLYGHLAAVEALMRAGADLNLRNEVAI